MNQWQGGSVGNKLELAVREGRGKREKERARISLISAED